LASARRKEGKERKEKKRNSKVETSKKASDKMEKERYIHSSIPLTERR
jgi:hypothetical protein